MVPFILCAIGTATSLYSIMKGIASTADMIDSYIEDNVDIVTKGPVLGYQHIVAELRSKGERRTIEAYNNLIIECLDSVEGTSLSGKWKDHKFTKNEMSTIVRIGQAFHHWWASGYSGQSIANQHLIDPKVQPLFYQLENHDKAVIAKAQSLLISLAKHKK